MDYINTFQDFLSTTFGGWIKVIVFCTAALYLLKLIKRYSAFFRNDSYPLGEEVMPYTKPIKRIAFWKNWLPNPFKNFLSKYDGTLPKNIYEEYLEKHNKEMEVYPRQMLTIYLLIDFVLFLTFFRIVFFFDHHLFGHNEHPAYVLIEHVDAAGLINGALATILAIIIARIVESENASKNEMLDSNIKNIEKLASNINDTSISIHNTTEILKKEVGNILSSYTALERKDLFQERLISYKKILDIFENNPENELYYMSFSADFGCLRSQNLSVLLESLNINFDSDNRISNVDTNNIYRSYNYFDTTINQLWIKLKEVSRSKPTAVNMAFLDNNSENRSRKSQYQKYIDHALGDSIAEIVPWQKINESQEDFQERIAKYILKVQDSGDDLAYYIDFKSDIANHISIKKHLNDENDKNIKEIKETRAQVNTLDRMAFQFMMTMPVTGVRDRETQCCVITFSNVDAIGDNAGVYAFQSTDKDTIDNLKKIFETYKKQQEARNKKEKRMLSEWRSFVDFFNIHYKCYNLVKFKNIEEKVSEFLNGVAMADVKAAVSIQKMFREIGETIPEITYPVQIDSSGREVVNDYDEAFFENDGSYFAIGLFGEGNAPDTLAEYVINKYTKSVKLIRRKQEDESDDDKFKNIIQINDIKVRGIWEADNKKDIGFIAKIKPYIRDRNITIFIIGGINHFGTERMGEYLHKHWKDIYHMAKQKSFIAIYDIDDSRDEKIKEMHFFVNERDDLSKWTEKQIS